ncbi:DUF2797 domain-containing protein [Arthrobacter sp. FW306-05-C]|uniref:DUF2797 domain-containing protein n=1 Tax=Arthrobacter sp. FW306-05-C TaxID=2879620 RepID=UPI001F379A15|nr:DUF2797 domain-containing protein [Arthrobacter sp. FW306-05-C]UKA65754.1 DUF2797 domain-containing protein [Arthrobacter sp. FW306-05-C]
MTDTRYLVHGVFWEGPPADQPAEPDKTADDGGGPVLRLQSPEGEFREIALRRGHRLGFQVAEPGRFCLGHVQMRQAGSRSHVLCASAAPAIRGKQCERCFILDESRLMHDFHRGGRVTPGLREYLMQEHWLYVATFAGGATKVGTASGPRKWNRLAEQGAAVARYVARAQDGRVVRILEDLVTADVGLTQQVRSSAKAEALLQPLPATALDAVNARAARDVRALLARTAVDGFEPVDEQWSRPAHADALNGDAIFGNKPRHAYPHALEAGQHGFGIAALSGANALARLDGSDADFVVNLSQLAARTIVLGDFVSEVPAVQEALF